MKILKTLEEWMDEYDVKWINKPLHYKYFPELLSTPIEQYEALERIVQYQFSGIITAGKVK